jgi:hypothetical protein
VCCTGAGANLCARGIHLSNIVAGSYAVHVLRVLGLVFTLTSVDSSVCQLIYLWSLGRDVCEWLA